MHVNSIMKALLSTGHKRNLSGWTATAVSILALSIFLFQLWALLSHRLDEFTQIAVFASGMLGLTFLSRTATAGGDRSAIAVGDAIVGVLCVAMSFYFLINAERFLIRWPEADPLTFMDMALGIAFLALLAEATRRCIGIAMTALVLGGIAYILFGHLIPGAMTHRQITTDMLIDRMIYTSDGVMSAPMKVSATIAFALVVFGLVFERCGGGTFFSRLSAALVGRQVGGPAKATIVAGAFFGMISGSPAADSVTVGSFAVPMMKKEGYDSVFAGGITALAATGGAVLPPVMSTAAFLMAELTGIPYVKIALAAAIPGVLYFVCNLMQAHLYSLRHGYVGIRGDIPKLGSIIREYGQFSIPLSILIFMLIDGFPVVYCGLVSSGLAYVVSFFKKETRLDLRETLKCMERIPHVMTTLVVASAAAGVIVGTIMFTGIGGKCVSLISTVSGSNFFFSLVIAAVICIILGMGMPLISVYILVAVLVVPVLTQLGMSVMEAHLFVVYYSALSAITPPVAVAAFAVAPLAEAAPFAIGWRACRLGLVVFIIPFVFAYSPALILQGDYSTLYLIWCVITAIMGTATLAIGTEGYLRAPVPWFYRIGLLVAGLLMIIPGLFTDIIGMVASTIIIIWTQLKAQRVAVPQYCYRRKRVDPSAAESGPTWKLHDLVDKSP